MDLDEWAGCGELSSWANRSVMSINPSGLPWSSTTGNSLIFFVRHQLDGLRQKCTWRYRRRTARHHLFNAIVQRRFLIVLEHASQIAVREQSGQLPIVSTNMIAPVRRPGRLTEPVHLAPSASARPLDTRRAVA